MFSFRSWLFPLAFLAVVLFALVSPFEPLFRFAYVMAFSALIGYLWSRLSIRGVEVIRLPGVEHAQVGQALEERFLVINESRFGKGWLEIHELSDLPEHQGTTVVSLDRLSRHIWSNVLLCRRRGRFTLGPLVLSGGDPFGLFRHTRHLGTPITILVYPPTIPLPYFQLPATDLPGEGGARRRTHYLSPSAATVREYLWGDSYSRIHWPSTARLGRLMVKEFEVDSASDVWLVLDFQERVQLGSGEDNTEEQQIIAAGSIAQWCLDRGRPVGLLAHGDRRYLLPPRRGTLQMRQLLELLTLSRAQGQVSLGEVLRSESLLFGNNSTVLVITPATDPAWVVGLHQVARRGIQTGAVLMDAPSFGSAESLDQVERALQATHIPAYLVSQGVALDQSLRHPRQELALLRE